MSVLTISNVFEWHAAIVSSQNPEWDVQTIQLASDLTFDAVSTYSIPSPEGDGYRLYLTLHPGQTFEGNGFTLTFTTGDIRIEGVDTRFFYGFLSLPEEDRSPLPRVTTTVRNMTFVYTTGINVYNSALVATYSPSSNCSIDFVNLVIDSNAKLYIDYTPFSVLSLYALDCNVSGCFVRFGASTTEESEQTGYFITGLFGYLAVQDLPQVIIEDCAVVSLYNFEQFNLILVGSLASGSQEDRSIVIRNTYLDLSSQTAPVGPIFEPVPTLFYDVFAVPYLTGNLLLDIQGGYILYGDRSVSPADVVIGGFVGITPEPEDEPIPYTVVQMSDLATNLPVGESGVCMGKIETYGIVSVDETTVTLGLTDWIPFPSLGPGFTTSGYNPAVLTVFLWSPFNGEAIVNDTSLPAFSIALCRVLIDPGAVVAPPTVDLRRVRVQINPAAQQTLRVPGTGVPVRLWIQNSPDSNRSILSKQGGGWFTLPPSSLGWRASRPAVPLISHEFNPLVGAKLQIGLPRNGGGYVFASVPLVDAAGQPQTPDALTLIRL